MIIALATLVAAFSLGLENMDKKDAFLVREKPGQMDTSSKFRKSQGKRNLHLEKFLKIDLEKLEKFGKIGEKWTIVVV